MKANRTLHEYLIKKLKNPREVTAYLKVALDEYEKDGNSEAFLLALRTVVEAQGGISELAARTKLNRQNLYRALSYRGNPRLSTLGMILKGLGVRLTVESTKTALGA